MGRIREDTGRPRADVVRLARLGKKGESRIPSLLLLLLLAMGAYAGVQWFNAMVNYWYLQDVVRLALRDMASHPLDVEKGEEKILIKAHELQIPLQSHQIVVTVNPHKIQLRISWQQPIGFWRFTIPVPFEIEESRPLH